MERRISKLLREEWNKELDQASTAADQRRCEIMVTAAYSLERLERALRNARRALKENCKAWGDEWGGEEETEAKWVLKSLKLSKEKMKELSVD